MSGPIRCECEFESEGLVPMSDARCRCCHCCSPMSMPVYPHTMRSLYLCNLSLDFCAVAKLCIKVPLCYGRWNLDAVRSKGRCVAFFHDIHKQCSHTNAVQPMSCPCAAKGKPGTKGSSHIITSHTCCLPPSTVMAVLLKSPQDLRFFSSGWSSWWLVFGIYVTPQKPSHNLQQAISYIHQAFPTHSYEAFTRFDGVNFILQPVASVRKRPGCSHAQIVTASHSFCPKLLREQGPNWGLTSHSTNQ